jgi:hypothetical protein
MDLTEDEIRELTLKIKETIDNFKPQYITTPITYNCDRYNSPINYPIISLIKENQHVCIPYQD